MSRGAPIAALLLGGVLLAACGGDSLPGAAQGDTRGDGAARARDGGGEEVRAVGASAVEDFEPGEGGGFGQSKLPDVVTGGPHGLGDTQGSLDVVSLGKGGSIVVRIDPGLCDGPGLDLGVFENPFVVAGSGGKLFVEPGEVAVSADGVHFIAFPCQREAPWEGCAGLTPVWADSLETATDPAVAGGDWFDLADIQVPWIRWVRITDVGHKGGGAGQAGFDLDAVVGRYPGQPEDCQAAR